jgi:hypothetical protein
MVDVVDVAGDEVVEAEAAELDANAEAAAAVL